MLFQSIEIIQKFTFYVDMMLTDFAHKCELTSIYVAKIVFPTNNWTLKPYFVEV